MLVTYILAELLANCLIVPLKARHHKYNRLGLFFLSLFYSSIILLIAYCLHLYLEQLSLSAWLVIVWMFFAYSESYRLFKDIRLAPNSKEDSFDDLFASEQEAEKIINAYGLVMMKRADIEKEEPNVRVRFRRHWVAPKSMLPHSKAEIREAIKLYFAECASDQTGIDSMISGYERLAQYIPDDEFDKVMAATGNSAEEVFERIRAEQESLLRELYTYLSSLNNDRSHIEYALHSIDTILKMRKKPSKAT